jgi:hypothetical protein
MQNILYDINPGLRILPENDAAYGSSGRENEFSDGVSRMQPGVRNSGVYKIITNRCREADNGWLNFKGAEDVFARACSSLV